jgi:hypothetical protein
MENPFALRQRMTAPSILNDDRFARRQSGWRAGFMAYDLAL